MEQEAPSFNLWSHQHEGDGEKDTFGRALRKAGSQGEPGLTGSRKDGGGLGTYKALTVCQELFHDALYIKFVLKTESLFSLILQMEKLEHRQAGCLAQHQGL